MAEVWSKHSGSVLCTSEGSKWLVKPVTGRIPRLSEL